MESAHYKSVEISLLQIVLQIYSFATMSQRTEGSQAEERNANNKYYHWNSNDPRTYAWLRMCGEYGAYEVQPMSWCSKGIVFKKPFIPNCVCPFGVWILKTSLCDDTTYILVGDSRHNLCYAVHFEVSSMIFLGDPDDVHAPKAYVAPHTMTVFHEIPLDGSFTPVLDLDRPVIIALFPDASFETNEGDCFPAKEYNKYNSPVHIWSSSLGPTQYRRVSKCADDFHFSYDELAGPNLVYVRSNIKVKIRLPTPRCSESQICNKVTTTERPINPIHVSTYAPNGSDVKYIINNPEYLEFKTENEPQFNPVEILFPGSKKLIEVSEEIETKVINQSQANQLGIKINGTIITIEANKTESKINSSSIEVRELNPMQGNNSLLPEKPFRNTDGNQTENANIVNATNVEDELLMHNTTAQNQSLVNSQQEISMSVNKINNNEEATNSPNITQNTPNDSITLMTSSESSFDTTDFTEPMKSNSTENYSSFLQDQTESSVTASYATTLSPDYSNSTEIEHTSLMDGQRLKTPLPFTVVEDNSMNKMGNFSETSKSDIEGIKNCSWILEPPWCHTGDDDIKIHSELTTLEETQILRLFQLSIIRNEKFDEMKNQPSYKYFEIFQKIFNKACSTELIPPGSIQNLLKTYHMATFNSSNIDNFLNSKFHGSVHESNLRILQECYEFDESFIFHFEADCPLKINCITHRFKNHTVVKLDSIAYSISNVDISLEAIWKLTLFVESYCGKYFTEFSPAVNLKNLFTALEGHFKAESQDTGPEQFIPHRSLSLLFGIENLQNFVVGLDACVGAAKDSASKYNDMLSPRTSSYRSNASEWRRKEKRAAAETSLVWDKTAYCIDSYWDPINLFNLKGDDALCYPGLPA